MAVTVRKLIGGEERDVQTASPLFELLPRAHLKAQAAAWAALRRMQREAVGPLSRVDSRDGFPWCGPAALTWNRERFAEALTAVIEMAFVDAWAVARVLVTPDTMLPPKYLKRVLRARGEFRRTPAVRVD